jgi:hypothetical protein
MDQDVHDDLADLFSNSAGWEFATTDTCRARQVYPNQIAYREARATLCLICRQSTSGFEHALSAGGLELLGNVLDAGMRKDGTRVACAYVVLIDHQLKIKARWTVAETRERVAGLVLHTGRHGNYWWVRSEGADDPY